MSKQVHFDAAESRRYWRHAPSGLGKHDTSELTAAGQATLTDTWKAAFNGRFAVYPEEGAFLQTMAKEFAGKSVLSIGTGLGLHEIYYAKHGASRVVCCDIVDTNLATIDAIAKQHGLPNVETYQIQNNDLPEGKFDVVFFYGSLMAMPYEDQEVMAKRSAAALLPGGSLILMLYTWKFAQDTCHFANPSEFDPLKFARITDPTVGDEHCPWADWHDREKVEKLFGGLRVTREQLWNQDWYVWFGLTASAVSGPTKFFDIGDFIDTSGALTLSPGDFHLAEAVQLGDNVSTIITTSANQTSYAALSEVYDLSMYNAFVVEGAILSGGISVGVLDTKSDTFIGNIGVKYQTDFLEVAYINQPCSAGRVVVSNFQPEKAAQSVARLNDIVVCSMDVPTADFLRNEPA